MHIFRDYVGNMHNDVHISRKNTFNMHICAAKIEKAAKGTVIFVRKQLCFAYFEVFSKKYAGRRAYFWHFL